MDVLQIDGKEIPLLEAPQGYDDPPRRILYVLFKHKLMICVIFILLIVPMFVYLLFRAVEYTAEAKVLINPTRDVLGVSPTGGRTVNMTPSTDMINTEIQIIKSPELAERLAADIPLSSRENRTEAEIRRVARNIRGRLEAAAVRGTSVIKISLTSALNHEWAVSAVNRAAEIYLEQQLKVRKAQGIEAFYDEQEKRLRGELLNAEDALKTFQEKEKIIDATQEVAADLSALQAF